MQEVNGDLWDFHNAVNWIVIPTNGAIRQDGGCVMGRGLALAASRKFVSLPYQVGTMLGFSGNHVFEFPEFRIYSFPTKHHWRQKADLALIVRSAEELATRVAGLPTPRQVFLPRVGCGLGRLKWAEVQPILSDELDQRFTVVHREGWGHVCRWR